MAFSRVAGAWRVTGQRPRRGQVRMFRVFDPALESAVFRIDSQI